jgi:small subunit ribosomal protein S6
MAVATTQRVHRTREYEMIYILRADIESEVAEKVASRLEEVIARESGKLVKIENWGRRRLAYEIKKQRRGVYTYLKFLGAGPLVSEMERNLRMLDSVLRFQTVLLNDDVNVEEIEIDPEALKFAPLAPVDEDERDESRERELGLVDSPDGGRYRGHHSRSMNNGNDDDDDGDGDDDMENSEALWQWITWMIVTVAVVMELMVVVDEQVADVFADTALIPH